jgi:ArsR family transcriptional regulator
MKLTIEEFNRISKALADPQRREILQKLIASSNLSCSDIHALFDVSQPTVSHHLKELAFAGLVDKDKQGQFCFYHVKHDILAAYVSELEHKLGIDKLQVAPRVR